MDKSCLIEPDKIQLLQKQVGNEDLPLLLDVFKSELQDYQQRLKHKKSLNTDKLGRICHSIKGSASSFGAKLLYEKSVAMDSLYKNGQYHVLESEINELSKLLAETASAIDKIKRNLS